MAANRSNGWLKWLIIFAGAAVAVAGGLWYFNRGGNDAPLYQTAAVARGDVTQVVTATGTLNPVVNVTVGSQVSGRITKLNADFNSIVKSNEVIAEIDPSTYAAQLNQAMANLANARANLELQQANLKRAEQLYTNNLIAESDYDTAFTTRDEAAAQVQIQNASVTNATANLSYCKILSPVDGVVISRDVDVGQTVAASLSAPTLFQIANDLTKMQIDSSVAEADVGGVAEGQEVDFTVDAYPYRTFRGTITQVRNSPTTVNNVVTYDCVIGVTNADNKLKPGMTANVSIVIAQSKNALEIPNGALRFRPADESQVENDTNAALAEASAATNLTAQAGDSGNRRGGGAGGGQRGRQIIHTVYVLPADGGSDKNVKLRAVQIKTGITDGLNTEVLSGLNEGEQVVIGLNVAGTVTQSSGNNPFSGRGGRRF